MPRLLLIFWLIVLPAGALRAQPAAIPSPAAGIVTGTAASDPTISAADALFAPIDAPDTLRVVVLGSSTAAGHGASEPDSSWVWRYRTFLSAINPAWTVINLAVGGYSTYKLQPSGYATPAGRPRPDTARNITRALALRPSAIIVNLPSNDAASDYGILEQTDNFERIADEAARAQVPLWVSTTQPRNFDEAKRQNIITMRDWIRGRFVDRALDFWEGLAEADGRMLPMFDSGDGIHLNDDGHALLFARVRDANIPDAVARTTWIARSVPAEPSLLLEAYPNPARDVATVHVKTTAAGPMRLFVQDLLGRVVMRSRERYAPAGNAYTRLDVSSLAPGIYFLMAQAPDGISRTRLVITR